MSLYPDAESLRRKIDMPATIQWRGADEKKMLCIDKLPVVIVDGFKKFTYKK